MVGIVDALGVDEPPAVGPGAGCHDAFGSTGGACDGTLYFSNGEAGLEAVGAAGWVCGKGRPSTG
jgi:hypothetical protein